MFSWKFLKISGAERAAQRRRGQIAVEHRHHGRRGATAATVVVAVRDVAVVQPDVFRRRVGGGHRLVGPLVRLGTRPGLVLTPLAAAAVMGPPLTLSLDLQSLDF